MTAQPYTKADLETGERVARPTLMAPFSLR
jgi:hypothetical protein